MEGLTRLAGGIARDLQEQRWLAVRSLGVVPSLSRYLSLSCSLSLLFSLAPSLALSRCKVTPVILHGGFPPFSSVASAEARRDAWNATLARLTIRHPQMQRAARFAPPHTAHCFAPSHVGRWRRAARARARALSVCLSLTLSRSLALSLYRSLSLSLSHSALLPRCEKEC